MRTTERQMTVVGQCWEWSAVLTTVYTVNQPAIYSISASVTYKFCKHVWWHQRPGHGSSGRPTFQWGLTRCNQADDKCCQAQYSNVSHHRENLSDSNQSVSLPGDWDILTSSTSQRRAETSQNIKMLTIHKVTTLDMTVRDRYFTAT